MSKYIRYNGQLYKAMDLGAGGIEKLKSLVEKWASNAVAGSPAIKKTADGVSFKVVRRGGDGRLSEQDTLQLTLKTKTDATKKSCAELRDALYSVTGKLRGIIGQKPMFRNVEVNRIRGDEIVPGKTVVLDLISFITNIQQEIEREKKVSKDFRRVEGVSMGLQHFLWNLKDLDMKRARGIGAFDPSLAQNLAKLNSQILSVKAQIKATVQKFNASLGDGDTHYRVSPL